MPRAGPDHEDREVIEVAQEARGAYERVEILGVSDVARVHDHELALNAALVRPPVLPLLRRKPRGVDPVGNHAHAFRRRAFFLESLPHRVSDGDDAVGPAKVERNERAQQPHHDGILEPLELDGDLREDVLADHHERGAVALRHQQRDVGDDRRVGHADDDVRPLLAQASHEGIRQVRDVVRGTGEQLAALERRRRNAKDLDAVSQQTARLVLVAMQHSGDHRDVRVLRERLAEIRQQLGRRLDARPVVLIQDEQAQLAGR